MKTTIFIIMAMIMTTLSSFANDDKGGNETIPFHLEDNQSKSDKNIHRAPAYIPLEIFFHRSENTIDVVYGGYESGKVFLYYEDSVIFSDFNLNTSFMLPYGTGTYKIKIETVSWTAEACLYLD